MNFDGEGGKDVQGVLETLMGQLMSKEVLYEPLKELHQKVYSPLLENFDHSQSIQFPEYLESNRAIMPTDDQVRYDKQYSIVGQVVAIFETPDYSDDDPATTAEIVSLMSEVSCLHWFFPFHRTRADNQSRVDARVWFSSSRDHGSFATWLCEYSIYYVQSSSHMNGI